MTFIYQKPDTTGFQRGWNMYMNLIGQKQIQARTEQQQAQFDEKMKLANERFKLVKERDQAEIDKARTFRETLMKTPPSQWSDAYKKLYPEDAAKAAFQTEQEKIKSKITETRQKKIADYRQEQSKKLFEWKIKYKNKHPDKTSMRERQLLGKELTKFAITIESDPEGPGTKQAAEFFNKWSMGNSVYVSRKKDKWFGKAGFVTERVDLPAIGGIQVTADDVRTTMEEEKMSLEQVLEMLGAIE